MRSLSAILGLALQSCLTHAQTVGQLSLTSRVDIAGSWGSSCVSPDGKNLYMSYYDAGYKVSAFSAVAQLDTKTPTNFGGGATYCRVSADGKHVYYTSEDGDFSNPSSDSPDRPKLVPCALCRAILADMYIVCCNPNR
jgi:hypothetical protein